LRAYQTAELDERVARIVQLSDAELHRNAAGGGTSETIGPRLLTIDPG
jgi:hypothetical protein